MKREMWKLPTPTRAFGEQLKRLDANGDETGDTAKYSYGGKELDDMTNLYYFNARYHDATIGRFINVDPVQDGSNWYVYCGNNPLSLVDPTGLNDDKLGWGGYFDLVAKEGFKNKWFAEDWDRLQFHYIGTHIAQSSLFTQHEFLFDNYFPKKTQRTLTDVVKFVVGEFLNWGDLIIPAIDIVDKIYSSIENWNDLVKSDRTLSKEHSILAGTFAYNAIMQKTTGASSLQSFISITRKTEVDLSLVLRQQGINTQFLFYWCGLYDKQTSYQIDYLLNFRT